MSASGHGTDHGHTPAAWTGVTIAFIGCLIGSVGAVMVNGPIVIGGLVVMAVGGIVGKIMSAAGMGAKPRKAIAEQTAD